MKNSHFQHLLLTICCAAGLSSCIYSDMGRTIGSIGTKVPRLVPMADDEHWTASYCGQLYRKEGRYYVSLPLAWVPERRRGYEFFPLFSEGNPFEDCCTYNRPYSAAELRQYPATPEYYEVQEPKIIHFHEPDAHGALGLLKSKQLRANPAGAAKLKPAPEFDPAGAESLGIFGVQDAAPNISHLDKQHAWYHYPLLPVQAAATVADVAVSAVLMPLSFTFFWFEEITSGVDFEFSDPWSDYTRPSYFRPRYDTGYSAPESMTGKCLVLGNKRFDFPEDNSHRYTRGGREYSHAYYWWGKNPSRQPTFHEDCKRQGAPGFIRHNSWCLYFTSPTTGTAVRLHSTPQDNQPASLPFRITELK